MLHGNARLAPAGLLLVWRVAAGEPQVEATRQMGLSRGMVAKWWRRRVEHGKCGADRSQLAAEPVRAEPLGPSRPPRSRSGT